MQTPQSQAGPQIQHHQATYPIQAQKYPVTISPIPIMPDANGDTQVSVRTTDNDEAKIRAVKIKADLEEKYMEYQHLLWDLQKAIPNGALGAPSTIYPSLPAQPEEGEPKDLSGNQPATLHWHTSLLAHYSHTY